MPNPEELIKRAHGIIKRNAPFHGRFLEDAAFYLESVALEDHERDYWREEGREAALSAKPKATIGGVSGMVETECSSCQATKPHIMMLGKYVCLQCLINKEISCGS